MYAISYPTDLTRLRVSACSSSVSPQKPVKGSKDFSAGKKDYSTIRGQALKKEAISL